MKIEFKNKTVFLTGASRGIGKRMKEVFEEAGARVIAPVRDELNLADTDLIEKYLSENTELKIDIFIHCAGVNHPAVITEIDKHTLQECFQVNCFSAVQLLRAFLGHMKVQKWGRIIFISSLYAMVSKEGRTSYSASKNALTGLTKTLAVELGSENILVDAIAPGYIMTDMTRKNLTENEIRDIESQIPRGCFQSEDDIANLAAFLCSDLNQNITGQLIAVDGGFTCR